MRNNSGGACTRVVLAQRSPMTICAASSSLRNSAITEASAGISSTAVPRVSIASSERAISSSASSKVAISAALRCMRSMRRDGLALLSRIRSSAPCRTLNGVRNSWLASAENNTSRSIAMRVRAR